MSDLIGEQVNEGNDEASDAEFREVMHQTAIQRIVEISERMERFWRCSHGWAPKQAAVLLASARLDRQTSFAHTLRDCLEPFSQDEAQARQILGYATLRSLSEGVLKTFFAVWLTDYLSSPDARRDRHGNVVPPEAVSFDQLIAFYSKKVDSDYESFLRRIQARGNAIHFFNDRDIGVQDELIADIVLFRDFLVDVDSRLPYPDSA